MLALSDRFRGNLLSDAQALEAPHFAGRERSSAADLLVRIAEIDVRKLYLPAGYPTMSAYCVEELRLSEDEAANRLHAARTARKFPILFVALDEGKVDLTGVRLLAAHLTEENVEELVAAATVCRSVSDLKSFLQYRFAEPDLLTAPAQVDESHVLKHVSRPLEPHANLPEPPNEAPQDPTPSLAAPPLPVEALEWVELKVKVRRAKLQQVRDLLSHSVPSGNASVLVDRAFDAVIEKVEKRKFAACKKPRGPRPNVMRQDRFIPADVRRAVWERDSGQCTFVSVKGKRCGARRALEFDHVIPVARGGAASVENLRLRCRGHNQYAAEQAFGVEFMKQKREKPRAPAAPGHRFRGDVIAGLRALGVRAREAARVVERSGALHKTTLEDSMRAAMASLGRPSG